MRSGVPPRAKPVRRHPAVATAAGLVLSLLGVAALAACGSGGGGGTSPSPGLSSPDTASFSGTAHPGLSSAAESARAAASAAASSASARASEFESSVSARTERANAAAQKELKNVKGRGNATSDVSLTGKPRSETSGLFAVLVNITNSSDSTASYAVQVDFSDPDGKVVETRYVGAEDLEAGERAHPLAISRKPPEPKLTARIAKAQRY